MSPLNCSEAAARAVIACSCARSFVTASCSAAASSGVSRPESVRLRRASRASAPNRSSANDDDRHEHGDDGGQPEKGVAGLRHR